MPGPQTEKTIDIRMTKPHTFKGGKTWPAGLKARVTRRELAEREIPADSYQIVDAVSGLPPAENPEKQMPQAATAPAKTDEKK